MQDMQDMQDMPTISITLGHMRQQIQHASTERQLKMDRFVNEALEKELSQCIEG